MHSLALARTPTCLTRPIIACAARTPTCPTCPIIARAARTPTRLTCLTRPTRPTFYVNIQILKGIFLIFFCILEQIFAQNISYSLIYLSYYFIVIQIFKSINTLFSSYATVAYLYMST